MKSLRLYQCNVCKLKREISQADDTSDVVRCIMTEKCQGFISLLGIRRGTKPKKYDVSIFVDYTTRGFKQPAAPTSIAQDANLYLEAGQGILALAICKDAISGPSKTFSVPTGSSAFTVFETLTASAILPTKEITMKLNEISKVTDVGRSYSFKVTTTTIAGLAGEDASSLRRTLRCEPTDSVYIAVDGVILSSLDFIIGTDYVEFTPQLSNASIIDITVIKPAVTSPTQLSLTFKPLPESSAFRKSCSWGNALKSTTSLGSLITYFCIDVTALDPHKSYTIAEISVGSTVASLDRCGLLLGSKPFSFQDKTISSVVLCSSLTSNTINIIKDDDGLSSVVAKTQALTNDNVYPQSLLTIDDLNITATSIIDKQALHVIGPT